MLTRETAEQYLRESRRSMLAAQARGLQEWAAAFMRRAQSLERIIARLPSESVVVEARA
jgi:hypothetical protein